MDGFIAGGLEGSPCRLGGSGLQSVVGGRESGRRSGDDNGEGAHTIEINLRFAGNKKFPIWFLVAYNVYNDPNNSLYLETGYTFNVLLNKLTLYLGTAVGASSWYQFNFKDGVFRGDYMTSFGLTFSREIYLEDWLLIDFALTDIINFYHERNTILFTTTIKIE